VRRRVSRRRVSDRGGPAQHGGSGPLAAAPRAAGEATRMADPASELAEPLASPVRARPAAATLLLWLSARKTFRRRRQSASGRRVRRVHAARPMRRRVPVLIALRIVFRLVFVLLVLA
jgi:hypothetical protein